jgi:dTDP-4-amino-4,6-dideoxygalactose transaminase
VAIDDHVARSVAQLGRQWPWYEAEAVELCRELLIEGRSFDYYCGPEITALERGFAARTQRKHALSFNSGTSALLAAYVALGIGPGDEVLVPSFTFLATASPLFLLGAVPVLCDSGDEFGNVTVASLEPHLTSKTRAIALTHLWGQPCAMSEITSFARECRLPVVADCSHAHGSTYLGQEIGHFGDLAVYSLGSHKIVSGGLGGILLCDEDLYFDTACLLGHFKQRRRSLTTPARAALADVGLGGNLRISPIAAVLAESHLARLDQIMATKAPNVRAMADLLCQLPGVSALPDVPETSREGFYGCVLLVDKHADHSRDELVGLLSEIGVPVSEPLTAPLHRASVFAGARVAERQIAQRATLPHHRTFNAGDLPHSEQLHRSWLALPATYLHGDAKPVLAACTRATERLFP